MSQLMKMGRAQLQLFLAPASLVPHPIAHIRNEAIEALADLLLEAMGAEENGKAELEEVSDEREDHA